MPGSSTGSFTDADDYKASFSGMVAEFTLISPGAFAAHADRTELRHMHLMQARESLARVAYFALPADPVFISFSADPSLPLIWRGTVLGHDEIILHARGEHFHQRTDGPGRWGLIALPLSLLAASFRAETGSGLIYPESGRIIRPPPRERKSLLRVNRQAARLAETRPVIVGHPEVARAMEHELASLLVRCLAEGKVCPESAAALRAADVMQRFESVLAASPQRGLTAAKCAALLGVSPRKLHQYCLAFLGVGLRRYVQLRQLTRARAAIRCANPSTTRITELAESAGFARRGRFAELYKAVFGETPVATLRRAGEA
jgi:AraC-like DNA-binding protein